MIFYGAIMYGHYGEKKHFKEHEEVFESFENEPPVF